MPRLEPVLRRQRLETIDFTVFKRSSAVKADNRVQCQLINRLSAHINWIKLRDVVIHRIQKCPKDMPSFIPFFFRNTLTIYLFSVQYRC